MSDFLRFTATLESHYTDPDALVDRGGRVRYQPTSTLRAVTLTITDNLTGAVTKFHGRHDGDTPLFEWNTNGAGEALASLTGEANEARQLRKLLADANTENDRLQAILYRETGAQQ